MPTFETFRRHLTELVVVFAGVALAFAVENLREDLNERAVGEQYLQGFREDLSADLAMLRAQREARRSQMKNAVAVLDYFDGHSVDPQQFFEAYYTALRALYTAPNRNTMDEVLSSGNLRLIRDTDIRRLLLDLYVTYDRIERSEEHISRDFDSYLYDPTFSSIRAQLEGPWEDIPENRNAVEILRNDVRIQNGFRLLVANLLAGTGLLDDLELARKQVEQLLEMIPSK